MNTKFPAGFSLFLLLCVSLAVHAQNKAPYDAAKVSDRAVLNLEKNDVRGIEDKNGVVYYVEKDTKTLTAYQNGKIKWRTNVITACGKSSSKECAIRQIKLKKEKLLVTIGKRDVATVDLRTGKTTYEGKD